MADNLKKTGDQGWVEYIFEKVLWQTRYVVIAAVICSIVSAIVLFFIGSAEIYTAAQQYFASFSNHLGTFDHSALLMHIIAAIDLYLIGVVLMIFGFGIYELFVSKIDIARDNTSITILEIENLDELKNKIIKVVIMVLIVSFFERVLKVSDDYQTPLQMMYFAISIFALSLGVYLIKKHDPSPKSNKSNLNK